MKHYDQCPVCGSKDISVVSTIQDHMVSGEHFPVGECSACKARFTQDIPDQEDIGRYYKSDSYISHTDTRKGVVNRLYHAVRGFTLQQKRRAMERANGNKKGHLLDYGCGTGAFLGTMKSAGWQISGIEPDADAREMALKTYGINPLVPSALSNLPAESFDIITLWHVLEHVYDLQETLGQLYGKLRKGGHIFIAVPNYTSGDARQYGNHWAAWDVPRHLYHFAPVTMKTLLGKHGFQLVETKPMWFDSFYVSMLSEQYQHQSPHLISALWSGLKSNFGAIGQPEHCSSVIYHAVK